MVRYQVVGTLRSFIASRQNDVRRIVEESSLDAVTKHQLHTINVRQAWFETRAMFTSDGAVIPVATQRLARRIMKHVLSQHRRPSFRRCNMVVDQRQAVLGRSQTATTFDYWLRLGTLDSKVNVPLCTYPYHEDRPGKRASTVQVNTDRDGALKVGVVTDVSEPFRQSRTTYQPLRDDLAVDFGLSTLVATDDGDLMGQDFLAHLARLDRQIDNLARHRQRAGRKTRSERYDRLVKKLRGYVTTEINRVLEHLVRLKRPARLIVEKLDFRHPDLSKRMNRLIRRCGRKVFRQKLQDLQERFGIEVFEVDPAYTSQRCSSCGYTDRSNRPARAAFRCGRCGHTCHADVDAARVVRGRRSGPGSTARGGPRKRVPAVSYWSGRGSSGRIADARGRQAGASRRSSQQGWRGKPPGIGFHPPGSAGSALPDAAAQHVDAVSRRQ
jgi:putative transposase